MQKTQAQLSESIRNRLDLAYRNAESLLSGVVSSCRGYMTTDITDDERRALERLRDEAYQAGRALAAVKETFKARKRT